MTLYLENTSKNKVITLRYGEGNNKMLQLNPGEKKPLPVEITKYKLKTYLHLFKDLKVVEELKEDKKNAKKINPKPENIDDNSKEGKEVGQDDTEGQSNNIPNESENSQEGEKSQSDSDSNGDRIEDNSNEDKNDQPTLFTEKELNGLKADQIKELARTLGIEVTEDSTKKGLIPVILDKQGKLE